MFFSKARTLALFLALGLLAVCARAQTAPAPIAVDPLVEMMFDPERVVEAPTRSPQPISRVAENVTVVTADEIRGMNAHTIVEVLQHVNGLFVDFAGQDFGSDASLYIQGSNETHVLVLVDEIPWNFLSGGGGFVDTIPVEIVDRIEIIKGPASSTWGSALGGVVNIVTRRPVASRPLSGMVSASLGERDSYDGRAEVSGTKKGLGYLLYAGRQHSEGLVSMREFDSRAFFGKAEWAATDRVTLGLSSGATNPEYDRGDLRAGGILAQEQSKVFWLRGAADARFAPDLSGHLSLFRFNQLFRAQTQEDGQYAPSGDLFKDQDFDEATWGGSGQLVWSPEGHTVVAGVDYRKGELDYKAKAGDYLQSQGAPAVLKTDPDTATWGLYLNDTAALGIFTLVPGVRFDHNDQWGWFFSPSLGLTCKAGAQTLLRGSVARGFTSPPLSDTTGGGLFLDPNPKLEPEEVWSYQLGFETGAIPALWLKATGFLHDQDKALETETSPDNPNNLRYVNAGHTRRTGFEVEAKTAAYYGVSARGGFTTVYIRPEDSSADRDIYTYDLGLNYEKSIFKALLLGHFVWWDTSDQGGSYDDSIWDLHATCRLYEGEGPENLEGFFSVRNLFNGDQYAVEDYRNPDRWVEAGVRWLF